MLFQYLFINKRYFPATENPNTQKVNPKAQKTQITGQEGNKLKEIQKCSFQAELNNSYERRSFKKQRTTKAA